MKYRIFGPPGSGKTTWMINKITEIVNEGTPIEKIACLSFTNQTVNEFLSRFKNVNKSKFKYFSTIHSLCNSFKEDGKKIFSEKHFRLLKNYSTEEIMSNYFVYTLLRENSPHLDKIDYNEYELKQFVEEFEEIKEQYNLVDFNDLLKYFDHSIDIDYLFVDEAQDLSTGQLIVIDKLIQQCKKDTYIILDDAQAIFDWAGSNVKYILDKEDFKDVVLPKTYRLPKTHFKFACKVLKDLNIERYNNLILENKRDGKIESVSDLDDINFKSNEEYLILTRNTYQYKEIVDYCYENNFRINVERKPKYNSMVVRQVRNNYIDKKKLTVNIDKEDYNYILNNYIMNERPTVNISTIHKAKGSECENVILFVELTKEQYNSLYLDDDLEELKVFYVGCTRSKNNLYFVETNKKGYQFDQYL